jgi:hypothetical protein
MRRGRGAVVVVPVVEALEGRALLSASGLRGRAAGGAQVFDVVLAPENNSGVSGQARLTLRGSRLTVVMTVRGLEPGRPHAVHLHGFAGQPMDQPSVEPPPTAAALDPTPNGLGPSIVSETEATPFVGPIIKTISPGVVSRRADGSVTIRQTVSLRHDNYTVSILPLEFRQLEVHGLTVGGAYQPTVGVAGGHVVPAGPLALRARR